MSNFLTPLRVERLDSNKWRVLEEFDYRIGADNSPIMVVVPVGMITDFGSVPRVLWNILPPVGGPADKAFVIHDELYQRPWVRIEGPLGTVHVMSIDRAYADKILLEAMQVLGVGRFSRWAIYAGVRAGGWPAWNGHRHHSQV